MRKKNLTKEQKTYIASCGLKPNNWYIETETEDAYYFVSKTGQHRLIKKENCKWIAINIDL